MSNLLGGTLCRIGVGMRIQDVFGDHFVICTFGGLRYLEDMIILNGVAVFAKSKRAAQGLEVCRGDRAGKCFLILNISVGVFDRGVQDHGGVVTEGCIG